MLQPPWVRAPRLSLPSIPASEDKVGPGERVRRVVACQGQGLPAVVAEVDDEAPVGLREGEVVEPVNPMQGLPRTMGSE
ncbi:MAG: hypothetical protein OXE42_10970 [Gammaproteobacteria bacterium]|nr:hypothetical protein [Gammaproteobacteria bacterium]